jgi:hypothetical protein
MPLTKLKCVDNSTDHQGEDVHLDQDPSRSQIDSDE